VQAGRSQDVQAPRNQDIQAPRGQDVQAPRNQDVQAPRNQDVQAPRSPHDLTAQSTDSKKAEALVREAEAACKAGNTAQASEKALAALDLMKR
jgi:hypothetical protein